MTGGGRPRVAGIPVGSVERIAGAGRLLTRARSGADGRPPAATAEAPDNRARLTAVIDRHAAAHHGRGLAAPVRGGHERGEQAVGVGAGEGGLE